MGTLIINPYLGNIVAGSVGAYSLRSLSSNTTNVVRVRRSSDDDEADFTATEITDGTLTSWVGGSNNGFVKTWYDQSGNGNNVEETTFDNQPKIVNSGSLYLINGKPAIFVDTTNFRATIPALLTYDNLSVFQVVTPTVDAAADVGTVFFYGIDRGGGSAGDPGFSLGGLGTSNLAGEKFSFFLRDNVLSNRLGSSTYSHLANEQLILSGLTISNGFKAYKNNTLININLVYGLDPETSPTGPSATIATNPIFELGNRGTTPSRYLQETIVYPTNKSSDVSSINSSINSYYEVY